MATHQPTQVTHSGWDLPFFPDPKPHFLHHSRYFCNYGIFLDHVFKTSFFPPKLSNRSKRSKSSSGEFQGEGEGKASNGPNKGHAGARDHDGDGGKHTDTAVTQGEDNHDNYDDNEELFQWENAGQ